MHTQIFRLRRKSHSLLDDPRTYCSRITVVHVHATVFFLKFTQRVTILQTVSNQEVTLKKTDKQAA